MEPGGAAEFHETRRPIRLKRSRDRLSFLFCFSVEKKNRATTPKWLPVFVFFPVRSRRSRRSFKKEPSEPAAKPVPTNQRGNSFRV